MCRKLKQKKISLSLKDKKGTPKEHKNNKAIKLKNFPQKQIKIQSFQKINPKLKIKVTLFKKALGKENNKR